MTDLEINKEKDKLITIINNHIGGIVGSEEYNEKIREITTSKDPQGRSFGAVENLKELNYVRLSIVFRNKIRGW